MSGRGFLRPGYKADVAIVKRGEPWTVTPDMVQSKCGWSPVMGQRYHWQVRQTLCNGRVIYDRGRFLPDSRGEALRFRMEADEVPGRKQK